MLAPASIAAAFSRRSLDSLDSSGAAAAGAGTVSTTASFFFGGVIPSVGHHRNCSPRHRIYFETRGFGLHWVTRWQYDKVRQTT